MPDERLQTITLADGTEVEIHALTPAEASRVKPDLFTWDDATVRKVATMAIVKPAGVLERDLEREDLERIFRATGSAWLQGWIRGKNAANGASPRTSERKVPEVEWLSPSFTSEKLRGADDTIENRIDVYEDRVRGWLLGWAEYLNSVKIDDRQHAGFAVLHLSLAYFEAFAIFLRGREPSRGKSAEFFRAGLLEVFPELRDDVHRDSILQILWEDGRSGLFHRGIARKRIRLRDDLERAFRFEADEGEGRVLVCRHSLVWRLLAHFDRYVGRLRNPEEAALRGRFEAAWRIAHR